MSNEVVGGKKTRRKIALRISITSLALAGLVAFAGILIGGEPWKALSTAGLVFLLNLLVLVSFVSVHPKLRLAQWITTPLIGILSVIFIWWEGDYGSGYTRNGDWIYVRSTYEVLHDWTMGFWWVVAALAILSFFSRTWRFIENNAALRYTYFSVYILGLLAAIIAWVDSGLSLTHSEMLTLLKSGLVILAVTAATIVIVYAFMERTKLRSEPSLVSTPSALPANLESLIDARIEAYLTDPANYSRLQSLFTDVASKEHVARDSPEV